MSNKLLIDTAAERTASAAVMVAASMRRSRNSECEECGATQCVIQLARYR